MLVTATTSKGGAIRFNRKHGAWASYAVAGVGGQEPQELMYAGLTLPDGRAVQLFVNRETGLIVVDLIAKNGKGGVELLRKTA